MIPKVPVCDGDRSVLIFEPQVVVANDLAESLRELQHDLDIVTVTNVAQMWTVLDAKTAFTLAIVPQSLRFERDTSLFDQLLANVPFVALHGDQTADAQNEAGMLFLESPFTSETVQRLYRQVISGEGPGPRQDH